MFRSRRWTCIDFFRMRLATKDFRRLIWLSKKYVKKHLKHLLAAKLVRATDADGLLFLAKNKPNT